VKPDKTEKIRIILKLHKQYWSLPEIMLPSGANSDVDDSAYDTAAVVDNLVLK